MLMTFVKYFHFLFQNHKYIYLQFFTCVWVINIHISLKFELNLCSDTLLDSGSLWTRLRLSVKTWNSFYSPLHNFLCDMNLRKSNINTFTVSAILTEPPTSSTLHPSVWPMIVHKSVDLCVRWYWDFMKYSNT